MIMFYYCFLLLLMIVIDYYYGDYLLLLMIVIDDYLLLMIICYCNKTKFSSSIYKVIRPVLKFLFSLMMRFHKYKKALKSTKSTINLLVFFQIRFCQL